MQKYCKFYTCTLTCNVLGQKGRWGPAGPAAEGAGAEKFAAVAPCNFLLWHLYLSNREPIAPRVPALRAVIWCAPIAVGSSPRTTGELGSLGGETEELHETAFTIMTSFSVDGLHLSGDWFFFRSLSAAALEVWTPVYSLFSAAECVMNCTDWQSDSLAIFLLL